ncbi:MAG: TonB-dependent receptor [Verrucomicrobia bacterium]|nr:TonB-dependent receptor [Verrucomicrobiota bacterium]
MKTSRSFFRRILGALAALLFAAAPGFAQAPGTIEGRVLNTTNGAYLENARVSIEGTTFQTFTNSYGEYRLTGVAPGSVTLQVFFTGLTPQTATLAVAAGRTSTRDFSLTQLGIAPKPEGDPVQLDAFVVAAVKETNAAAIAINEQRFAANIKNVVAADEFGTVTEGNVGEFLKFLPGVTLDYTAADARSVAVRGLPSAASAVTVDGNRIANTGAGVANRVFEFDQLSINNVSRIEVTKGPTPESSADAIGGTINLVSKSAFERSRAEFTYRAVLSMNHQWQQDAQFLSLGRSPGPGREARAKVLPGFDFTYVRPVSKDFGFTVTGLSSNIFNQQFTSGPRWNPTSGGSNFATLANPAMTGYQFNDGPKMTSRYSMGATLDWRVRRHDVVSVGGSWSAFDAMFNNHVAVISTAAPTAWSPTYTQGGTAGNVSLSPSQRKAGRATYVLNAKWRHDGPVWKLDASTYTSHSKGLFRDMDYGYFQGVTYSLTGLSVRFDGNNETRPDNISATLAGAPLDLRKLAPYTVGTASTQPVDSLNTNKGIKANVSRYVDLAGLTFQVKAGVDARRATAEARRPFRRWTFLGADGRAASGDERAGGYDFVDTGLSTVPAPYGNGAWQFPSAYKVYDLFKAHPEYFQHDEAFAIQQNALNSNVIQETITAEYLRFDFRLLKNRLWIVAGARHERTQDDGYGPLNDVSRTYQRTASGALVDGNPNVAGIQPIKIVADTATLNRLQYTDRGAHIEKSYGDYYPSLNLTYNVTSDLIARASYADTLSRPNYTNIIPGTTLPDPASTTARTITINNVNLKPWTARNYDVALSYYTKTGGEITAGVFRKDIKDFFGSTVVDVTPELLDQYGLDDSYATGGYLISYLSNVGRARIDGTEFNFRQPLKFLPPWARGVSVRYNITQLHLTGNRIADFSAFIRRSQNWGISLERPKYSVRVNWNARGQQRQSSVGGVAEPGTYIYVNSRLTMDVDAEYRFRKSVGFFLGARNIMGEPFVVERYSRNTPAYAKRYQRDDYGIAISAGLKGSF